MINLRDPIYFSDVRDRRLLKPVRWIIGVSLIFLTFAFVGSSVFAAEITIDMTAPECAETIVLTTDDATGELVSGECRVAEVTSPPPDPDPAPPPTNVDSAVLIGCSQDHYMVGQRFRDDNNDRIYGFNDLYPGFFTIPTGGVTYSGATIDRWIEGRDDPQAVQRWGISRRDALRAAYRGTEDFVLIRACTTGGESADDLRTVIADWQEFTNGLPVYVMPLDVSFASAGCSFADYDLSKSIVDEVVLTGEALLGPELQPLYQAHEVTPPGFCHPIAAAVDRQVAFIVDWLASEGIWTP